MKAFLALAVGTLALSETAQGAAICMPDVCQFQRSGQFSGFQDWGSGYLSSQQYHDYPAGNHRSTDVVNEQASGDEIYVDTLINVTANVVWRAQGKKGSGIYQCTKSTINFRIPPPCLLKNATKAADVTIGGDLDSSVYNEAGGDADTGLWHREVVLANSINVPISLRETQVANGNTKSLGELFFNFAVGVPDNAFDVNPICQQAQLQPGLLSAEEFAQRYPRQAHHFGLTRRH